MAIAYLQEDVRELWNKKLWHVGCLLPVCRAIRVGGGEVSDKCGKYSDTVMWPSSWCGNVTEQDKINTNIYARYSGTTLRRLKKEGTVGTEESNIT